jgi:hypothetical protein
MVGIPDGLAAWAENDSTFNIVMNHELAGTVGQVRAHGSRGSFNSVWTIDRNTLAVLEGHDLTPSPGHVYQWDAAAGRYFQGTTVWQRLCSADLAPIDAYSFEDLGTTDRILLNGEEVTDGRAWARVLTGSYTGAAFQLPRMGRSAFENLLAHPGRREKTIVIGLDDGSINTAPIPSNYPSEVFVYVGTKQSSGNPAERAGLNNGKLYSLQASRSDEIVTEESNEFGFGNATTRYVGSASFRLVELGSDGDVSKLSGLQLEEDIITKDLFRMQRVEDGAWDPRPTRANNFYFVTTASPTANSRLWRIRFDDIDDPERGGRIDILLRGNEGQFMFDNLAIDRHGRIILQEDPGNDPHNARVWLYRIDNGSFVDLAFHTHKFFDGADRGASFQTIDEESSGIIDMEEILGEGWFLLDVQDHLASSDPELVENGQLLTMFIDPTVGLR